MGCGDEVAGRCCSCTGNLSPVQSPAKGPRGVEKGGGGRAGRGKDEGRKFAVGQECRRCHPRPCWQGSRRVGLQLVTHRVRASHGQRPRRHRHHEERDHKRGCREQRPDPPAVVEPRCEAFTSGSSVDRGLGHTRTLVVAPPEPTPTPGTERRNRSPRRALPPADADRVSEQAAIRANKIFPTYSQPLDERETVIDAGCNVVTGPARRSTMGARRTELAYLLVGLLTSFRVLARRPFSLLSGLLTGGRSSAARRSRLQAAGCQPDATTCPVSAGSPRIGRPMGCRGRRM